MFSIILVDDEEAIFTIVERAAKTSFPEAAFTWLPTISAAEEYFQVAANPLPKLMLVDIDLRGPLTGLDLVLYMRANERTFIVPIVVLTGNSSADTILEAYQLGASTFTIKPDSYTAWKDYLTLLREYWFNIVSLPPYSRYI